MDEHRPVTAQDWDARVDRACLMLPERGRKIVAWLREPARLPVRIVAAILLILGGIFSILPVLGLWMLPLGLMLLAVDVALIRPTVSAAFIRARRRASVFWRQRIRSR